MHLTPEELIDVAEGTRAPASAPHLAACEACREQVDELRDMMATLNGEVPEPSPLFWDHLSARVRERLAAEPVPPARWLALGPWTWGLAAAVGTAVVVLAVMLAPRTWTPSATHTPAVVEAVPADAGSAATGEDPSFALLGDLAGTLDWDSAAEVGISMDIGAADGAVAELSSAERSELQRLLREAMSGSGV